MKLEDLAEKSSKAKKLDKNMDFPDKIYWKFGCIFMQFAECELDLLHIIEILNGFTK